MRGRLSVGLVVGAGLMAASLAWAAEKEGAKARNPEIQRIVSTAREESRVMEHLDMLCNRIGPRLTGSDHLTDACEWARGRFAAFGLDQARLEPWGEFPVGFNRGPWFGRVVEPEPRALEFVTMAWSAGTKGAVRGKAVLAPRDREELDQAMARGTLAGAWVLMPAPPLGIGGGRFGGRWADAPKTDTPKTDTPKTDTPKAAGPRPDPAFLRSLRKELEAAKVAGLVEAAPRGDLLHTGGLHRITWDKLPTLPAVTLLRKQYDEIAGWLGAGEAVTLEFDIRNDFKQGPITLYNVIADLTGSEKPDEYVIVGGHIDSWDGATGATDNGTGVATTLEAARILARSGVRPKRTIRFMLWSGEEQGLLGSAAYVKAHPYLMPKISAVLVHDGGTNYLSGIGATEAMLADFEQVFAPIKELDPAYPFEVRKVTGLFGGGSDHASFLAADVPGFFWGQSGRARYQRTHHTQFDTYDAAIPEYQVHSSLVIALAAYGIANLDHLLSREKLRAPAGFSNRRMLGVRLDELTVSEVLDDSVARRGGMTEGDVIVKVDGTRVGDGMGLRSALQAGGPKKVIAVLRGGKEIELHLNWPAPAPPP